MRLPPAAAAIAFILAAAAQGPCPAAEARLELADGTVARGELVAIDAETVSLSGADGPRTVPVATVRRIIREPTGRGEPPAVRVALTDGGELAGGDFLQVSEPAGETAVVTLADGRITLPLDRVKSVAWLAAGEAEPAWREGLPPQPAGDVVVIRREDGTEYVECAITAVGPETVTVVLDGEKIPVKRSKIVGLEFLREPTEPSGGTVVHVTAGRLQSAAVRWSPAGLELDGGLRLPASLVRSIDYAAGRTVPLAALPLEQADVEPFFGSLATVEGLAAFFGPRFVAAEDGGAAEALLARPRTVATWRVPADSRRFRASLSRDVAPAAAARVEVSLAVDGRESFRRRLDAATAEAGPLAIDCDVTGGRRLTLTVDFVPGDIGCGVRLAEAAFEK